MANATEDSFVCVDRSSDSTAWLLTNAFVILTMQAGFALLEAGMITARHASNILMKNLVDAGVGSVMFFMTGWAFAFGGEGRFAGNKEFFLHDTCDFPMWFFQYTFATTAATILSGSVAGRMRFGVYCVVSAWVTGVAYPIAAHWAWGPGGWLYEMGYHDFAGDGPIHLLGAVMGTTACILLGPRTGVYLEDGTYVSVRASSSNTILGTFLLYWGWFAFNSGSTQAIDGGLDLLAGKAAANTAIAAGAGTTTAVLYSYMTSQFMYVDVFDTAGAVLAALVGITGPCAVVQPWEAAVIGLVAAVLCMSTGNFFISLGIDDPIGVIPVHGVCGIWGLLSVGLFANPSDVVGNMVGLFHGGGFHLLGVQALAVVAFIGWGISMTLIFLIPLNRFVIPIRVSVEDERRGLDVVEHNLISINNRAQLFGTEGGEGGMDGCYATPETVFLSKEMADRLLGRNKEQSKNGSGASTPRRFTSRLSGIIRRATTTSQGEPESSDNTRPQKRASTEEIMRILNQVAGGAAAGPGKERRWQRAVGSFMGGRKASGGIDVNKAAAPAQPEQTVQAPPRTTDGILEEDEGEEEEKQAVRVSMHTLPSGDLALTIEEIEDDGTQALAAGPDNAAFAPRASLSVAPAEAAQKRASTTSYLSIGSIGGGSARPSRVSFSADPTSQVMQMHINNGEFVVGGDGVRRRASTATTGTTATDISIPAKVVAPSRVRFSRARAQTAAPAFNRTSAASGDESGCAQQ